MSKVWEKFDMEIAATPMPEPYQDKKVSVFSELFLLLHQYAIRASKSKLNL